MVSCTYVKINILPIYNLDEKLKYFIAIEKDETKNESIFLISYSY